MLNCYFCNANVCANYAIGGKGAERQAQICKPALLYAFTTKQKNAAHPAQIMQIMQIMSLKSLYDGYLGKEEH